VVHDSFLFDWFRTPSVPGQFVINFINFRITADEIRYIVVQSWLIGPHAHGLELADRDGFYSCNGILSCGTRLRISYCRWIVSLVLYYTSRN
jgi:hypothetical protein